MQVSNNNGNPQPTLEGKKSENQMKFDEAAFWVTHPIKRAVITGILTTVFTRTSFFSGLIYGGISGFSNLGLRQVYKKIDENASTELKAINYLFASTFPWIVSFGIMKAFSKLSAKPNLVMPSRVAIGTAVAVQLFTPANFDLLMPKTNGE